MSNTYVLGLDLGQSHDSSALAILMRPAGGEAKPVYALPHLQRWPLGTPYPDIVRDVTDLLGTETLKGAALVVDQTGVGRPVVDLLRRTPYGYRTVPVTITGGHAVTLAGDESFHVPKGELVSCLQVLFQTRRLKVAGSLSEAETLVRELSTFRVKITPSANETFGTWREGQHDDLVLATALCCWWAEATGAPAVMQAVEVPKRKRDGTVSFMARVSRGRR